MPPFKMLVAALQGRIPEVRRNAEPRTLRCNAIAHADSTEAVRHCLLESAQEDFAMIKLNSLPERALDLVSQASDGLRHMVPNGAGKWLETGAAIGALKTGSRVATTLVRRHPAAAVATVAGAGLLWYLARRRARQAENAPIEGTATRIEARRSNGQASKKPRTRSSTRARRSEQTATT